jgi:hypothetical protein
MKQLLMVLVAALMTAGLIATDAAARTRTRVVITARPLYDTEPGAIYGYAPGTYVAGRNGMLYGPYPRPRVQYGLGSDGFYGYGPAWVREQYGPGWFGW